MDTEILERHFDECRLPVEFLDTDPRNRRFWSASRALPSDRRFFVDVVTRRQREQRFRIFADDDTTLQLLDKRPATRHLLLQVRTEPDERAVVTHYLLGHDERQLFVLRSKPVISIREAMEVLKPTDVLQAERKGLKVVRQGDWFFIPMQTTFKITADMLLHRNETIGGPNAWRWGIRVGNPHIAEEQLLIFGQTRSRQGSDWVIRDHQLISVFVRGKVRHNEHSTIELKSWHRAVQNVTAAPTPTIGYFD